MQPQQTMPCPGCGVPTSRALVACGPCWKRVPGVLKGRFDANPVGSAGRTKVVAKMRAWLDENRASAR